MNRLEYSLEQVLGECSMILYVLLCVHLYLETENKSHNLLCSKSLLTHSNIGRSDCFPCAKYITLFCFFLMRVYLLIDNCISFSPTCRLLHYISLGLCLLYKQAAFTSLGVNTADIDNPIRLAECKVIIYSFPNFVTPEQSFKYFSGHGEPLLK